MMCDLRFTWHPGGMVIAEEEQTVMEVKVEGHLIVVEKFVVKETFHFDRSIRGGNIGYGIARGRGHWQAKAARK
jgi:hypothetical protein